MNFPRGEVLKLSLSSLFCALKKHKYRELPFKKLFWNDDLDMVEALACILVFHRCIHCGHESSVYVKVFKASQLKHLSAKKQRAVIMRVFDKIEAYENRSL